MYPRLGLVVIAVALGGCASGSGSDTATDPGRPLDPTATTRDDGVVAFAPPTSRPGETTSTSTTTTTAPAACANPSKGEGPTVAISAVEFRFEPACIDMTTDQGINVTNHGTVVHNVTLVVVGEEEVEFLGADLQPGENNATEAFGNRGPGANTYRLFCRYHQDQGMEAYLRVSPAG